MHIPGVKGTAGADIIFGGDGNDTFERSPGADRWIGGRGDDTYWAWDADDTIVEHAGEGTDKVFSTLADYTLPENVENLKLWTRSVNEIGIREVRSAISGTGNSGNNRLEGNTVDNILRGLGGDDLLEGDFGDDLLDGGPGIDTLVGGPGNDIYVVDNPLDAVVEGADASGGTADAVESSVSYVLPSNVERLTLTGSAGLSGSGNELANVITGNSGANLLFGFGGNDQLIGGAGADRMEGGSGDDTYEVDSAGDAVVELVGGGVDLVVTSVDTTLAANVENARVAAGAKIRVVGNSSANVITFVEAPSYYLIDRSLSPGATASGGSGNDLYVYELTVPYDLGEPTPGVYEYGLIELVAGGTDTLRTNVARARLPDQVENLVVSVIATDRVSYGWGVAPGELKPKYYGNAGNNVIDVSGAPGAMNTSILTTVGGFLLDGGLGADTMIGSAFNDIYYVDNPGDVVVEASTASDSVDTVVSSVSYALGSTIENLQLSGSAAVSGTGNALDNLLDATANQAANALAGGLGNDTYVIGVNDLVQESAGGGNDTVVIADGRGATGITARVSDYANVENLQARSGSGVSTLVGDAGANTLVAGGSGTVDGGAGDDILADLNYGDYYTRGVQLGFDLFRLPGAGTTLLGGAGNDTLSSVSGDSVLDGGAGNDLLSGWTPADDYNNAASRTAYVFGTGYGADRVQDSSNALATSTSTINLGRDNIRITDTTDVRQLRFNRSGNDLVISIAGTTDTLTVSAFWNTDGSIRSTVDTIKLPGGGILARDSILKGLLGSSRTTATTGDDLLIASTTVASTLSGGNGQDHLIGGAQADTLRGDAGNDVLSGGMGNDTLDGGAGDDVMAGGDGDDIYLVDSAADVVIETYRQEGKFNNFEFGYSGNDTVRASVSYQLGTAVENLELTGTASVNATGNELANRLRGNSGANRLDGLWGADDMAGGAGNDTYVVDNFGDVVTELANEGTDTVEVSSAYFTNSNFYSLGANVENLVLTDSNSVNGNGNALANSLKGNSGDNRLEGFAGLDVFEGGQGSDTLISLGQGSRFVFNRGDGRDFIINQATAAVAAGTLELGAGIASTDLVFYRGGADQGVGPDDLVIQIKNSSDSIVVKNHFASQSGVRTGGLSALAISGGGQLTRADLDALAVPSGTVGGGGSPGTPPSIQNVITGTAGADSLSGTPSNDYFDALDGDDFVFGQSWRRFDLRRQRQRLALRQRRSRLDRRRRRQ